MDLDEKKRAYLSGWYLWVIDMVLLNCGLNMFHLILDYAWLNQIYSPYFHCSWYFCFLLKVTNSFCKATDTAALVYVLYLAYCEIISVWLSLCLSLLLRSEHWSQINFATSAISPITLLEPEPCLFCMCHLFIWSPEYQSSVNINKKVWLTSW